MKSGLCVNMKGQTWGDAKQIPAVSERAGRWNVSGGGGSLQLSSTPASPVDTPLRQPCPQKALEPSRLCKRDLVVLGHRPACAHGASLSPEGSLLGCPWGRGGSGGERMKMCPCVRYLWLWVLCGEGSGWSMEQMPLPNADLHSSPQAGPWHLPGSIHSSLRW